MRLWVGGHLPPLVDVRTHIIWQPKRWSAFYFFCYCKTIDSPCVTNLKLKVKIDVETTGDCLTHFTEPIGVHVYKEAGAHAEGHLSSSLRRLHTFYVCSSYTVASLFGTVRFFHSCYHIQQQWCCSVFCMVTVVDTLLPILSPTASLLIVVNHTFNSRRLSGSYI